MIPPRLCRLFVFAGAFVGCSDYNLAGKDEPGPAAEPGVPDIVVSPDQVEVIGACGETIAEVQIRNDGEADLTVTGVTVEGAWAAEAPATPFTLSPGAAVAFPVTGAGEGRVNVESDDPDSAILSVPLSATADTPPTLTLEAPLDGSILAPGDLELRATVSDAEDAPTSLSLSWSSDVDGLITTSSPDSAGVATALWPAGRSVGGHVVTATVTDSCGGVASASATVCQDEGYEVDSFDLSAWHFEGVATWDATQDWLELTSPAENVVGTAFETADTVSGDNVTIEFLFYIGGGTGADGLSLTAIDTDRMTTYLGGTGCGIGYGGDASCTAGPALPGWSIEVDTYYNEGQDPTAEDHVMFTFDGDVDDPAAWAALPELEDTGWHTMSVVVAAPRVTVTIDEVTYLDQDLGGAFAFPAHVGFTAGTGGLTNSHLIDALQVTEHVCGD